jgi:hypothetical protein
MHDTASALGVSLGGTSASRELKEHAEIKITYVMFLILQAYIWDRLKARIHVS